MIPYRQTIATLTLARMEGPAPSIPPVGTCVRVHLASGVFPARQTHHVSITAVFVKMKMKAEMERYAVSSWKRQTASDLVIPIYMIE